MNFVSWVHDSICQQGSCKASGCMQQIHVHPCGPEFRPEFNYTYNLLVFVQPQWFSLLAHSVVLISEWASSSI